MEASRIRLGVVQPGESIADFNDALNTLQISLAYLYSNLSGDRFWYDTRPTLRKTVEDRETENNLKCSNDTVDLRIKEAYCWLLAPYIDRNADMKTIQWDTIRISGGTESIVTKAAKEMARNETLISKWAPALLLMELNNLPRLANYEVLEDAIRTGINSRNISPWPLVSAIAASWISNSTSLWGLLNAPPIW
ncbi:MAG: hypothetical protein LBN96_06400 [Desulfovibrio sp.]|nr:hypothetical protein [Desulfovibrio sp.]